MKPQQDEIGLWYYDQLPQGAVLITMDDYKNKLQRFLPGTPYCVQSFHTGRFECYRIVNTVSEQIIPFIEAKRAYFIKTK